eukprot:18677-Heterococcus_DN1.PRE.1
MLSLTVTASTITATTHHCHFHLSQLATEDSCASITDKTANARHTKEITSTTRTTVGATTYATRGPTAL